MSDIHNPYADRLIASILKEKQLHRQRTLNLKANKPKHKEQHSSTPLTQARLMNKHSKPMMLF